MFMELSIVLCFWNIWTPLEPSFTQAAMKGGGWVGGETKEESKGPWV
jgi:hypothetical protein